MYGGAAGGGKSQALLMAAAQYVHVPGYAAILLRENFPDLNQPDALIPRSKEWWKGKARWSERDRRWTFPSGATVTFGYLERDNDAYQYQGAAFQFCGIDELSQHTEFRYRYLFSRLRRPRSGPLADVPLRMRSGTNPGGRGGEWVCNRFVNPRTRKAGAVFVPARLADNPSLDAEAYVRGLMHLDPVTRAQLLHGDWDAYEGGRFKREWFRPFSLRSGGPHGAGEYHLDGGRAVPASDCWVFQTADPAASAEETARSDDPDYTAVCTFAVTPWNELLWLDCDRFRAETPDIVPRLLSGYELHRPAFLGVEAVAANRAVYQEARRTSMVVRELSPGGRDKLVRATPLMVLAGNGRLFVPEVAHWREDALAELLRFTGDPRAGGHDDVVDACAWGAYCLNEYGSGGDAPPMTLARRAW